MRLIIYNVKKFQDTKKNSSNMSRQGQKTVAQDAVLGKKTDNSIKVPSGTKDISPGRQSWAEMDDSIHRVP